MRETLRLRDESGFSIVEALVAAMVLIIVSIGILGALEATGSAGAQERLRSQAYQLAQQDQARLRAMKITQLLDYSQTRAVTVDERRLHGHLELPLRDRRDQHPVLRHRAPRPPTT